MKNARASFYKSCSCLCSKKKNTLVPCISKIDRYYVVKFEYDSISSNIQARHLSWHNRWQMYVGRGSWLVKEMRIQGENEWLTGFFLFQEVDIERKWKCASVRKRAFVSETYPRDHLMPISRTMALQSFLFLILNESFQESMKFFLGCSVLNTGRGRIAKMRFRCRHRASL